MATRVYPELTKDSDVMLGTGFLHIGPVNAIYSETTMITAGCLRGNAVLRPQIETVTLMAGSPQVPIKREPTVIGAQLEVTLIELSLAKLQKVFGMGDYETFTAGTVTVTDEEIVAAGFVNHHLQGYNINDDMVVTSDGATPVTYTEGDDDSGDYEIDYEAGLFRRTLNSTIPDNATVLLSYTWDRPPYEQLNMGVNSTVDVRPLKFTVPMSDGNRWYLKMWKASIETVGEISFQNEDYSQITVTFSALADRTKPAKKLLYSLEKEYTATT